MWLVWFIVWVLIAWIWMFFGTIGHCPVCGVELPKEFGYPSQYVDRCPYCGWHGS